MLTFSWPSHSALHLESWWSIGTQKGIKGISRHGTLLLRESEQGFSAEFRNGYFDAGAIQSRLPGASRASKASRASGSFQGFPAHTDAPRTSPGLTELPRASQSFPGRTRDYQDLPKLPKKLAGPKLGQKTMAGPKLDQRLDRTRNMNGPKVGPNKKHARTKGWTEKKHTRTKGWTEKHTHGPMMDQKRNNVGPKMDQ